MKAIFFTDGSCKPNPGFGGFGYFGYTFKESEKKVSKNPVNDTYFTSEGIVDKKENIEVIDIYEYIEYIEEKTTNNHAELCSLIKTLELVCNMNIKEVTIFSDSNYLVSNVENIDKWKENNWRRADSSQLIHFEEWKKIYSLLENIKQKNIAINIKWVKGHSNNFGNDVADFFSAIGSNVAANKNLFNTDRVILNHKLSFKEYKDSFNEKDIILNFKDMFYNPKEQNATYHFLADFENNSLDVGKRNSRSIFAINFGYVPKFIGKIKNFINTRLDNYSLYCIKLSKLKNKNYLKIIKYLDISFLLEKTKTGYRIITDSNDFIYYMNFKFPLILTVSNLYTQMLENYEDYKRNSSSIRIFDITNRLYEKNKLLLNNSVKYLNLNDLVGNILLNDFKIEVGIDIPSYLILKSIEEEIEEVKLILNINYELSSATSYVFFKLKNREIITCNMLNKFLLS